MAEVNTLEQNIESEVDKIFNDEELMKHIRDAVTEQFAQANEEITPENNSSVASHDEKEDVKLVRKAITIVRTLLAREAADGSSLMDLQDLMGSLRGLHMVLYNEEWDVTLEEVAANASEEISEDELFTGGEDMALTEEAKAELNSAVAEAMAPLLEVTKANSDAITSLITALTAKNEAPVAEEAPAAVETPVAEAEVETPEEVVEAEAEVEEVAEAQFPPKKDEEEEEEDEEKKPKAKAAAEDPIVMDGDGGEMAAPAQAEEEVVEEAEAEEEMSLIAQASAAMSDRGFFTGKLDINTPEGRRDYLRSVAVANKIPVGVVESVAQPIDNTADLKGQLLNLFRK